MSFEAEMIIPGQGTDDLGQRAETDTAFVRYAVTLACRTHEKSSSPDPLELIRERLEPIRLEEASEHLKFPRQVIVSTHSPAVVSQVNDDSLLIAELKEAVQDGQRFRRVCFNWLPGTWRATASPYQSPVVRGRLLAYLNPVMPAEELNILENGKSRRVADRDDLQMLMVNYEL